MILDQDPRWNARALCRILCKDPLCQCILTHALDSLHVTCLFCGTGTRLSPFKVCLFFHSMFLNDGDPILARQEKVSLNKLEPGCHDVHSILHQQKCILSSKYYKYKILYSAFGVRHLTRQTLKELSIEPCFILGTGANTLGEGMYVWGKWKQKLKKIMKTKKNYNNNLQKSAKKLGPWLFLDEFFSTTSVSTFPRPDNYNLPRPR